MAVEQVIHCEYADGSSLYLGEAVGDTPDDFAIAAQGIHEVLTASWQKFVDGGQISVEGLAKKIRQPFTQAEIMAQKSTARYFLAFDSETPQLDDAAQVKGFARIETYSPRNPLKRSYPNITDLEFRSGFLDEPLTARDARTLLFHSLRHYPYDRQVAAYTEEPNPSGRSFFARHGFTERRITVAEHIDSSSQLAYVHMEAPNQHRIFRHTPPLEHSFTYY